MADQQNNIADDCRKLLDNRAYIVLYRNGLRSYTGICLRDGDAGEVQSIIDRLDDDGPHITDDWTPSRVLHRLTEKQFGNIVGVHVPKPE